jgi:effector-binding domain-containing protein
MSTEPTVVQRAEQPYLAIGRVVTMQTIGAVADRIPEILGWLAARGIEPAGAPFLRYNVIDMERRLDIEAGVPVFATVAGDGEVVADVLPAGSYATVTHVGPYDQLAEVTAALLAWADEHALAWDTTTTDDGERWGCRLEIYKTNPAAEPDVTTWETELAFRLAD